MAENFPELLKSTHSYRKLHEFQIGKMHREFYNQPHHSKQQNTEAKEIWKIPVEKIEVACK